MIRISNRRKAGTRKNKRWARTNGPDRHYSINNDYKGHIYNAVGIIEFHPDGTPKSKLDTNFRLKANHADRVVNVNWKAINDAEKAKKLITEAIEAESARRLKEDEEADTSTMEGAKEYMEKVLTRKATTIEPGHI